jgi:hypothetical protein
MKPEQALDLVAGMLMRLKVPFQARDDGVGHRVLAGSTAVYINFAEWDTDAVISLSAPVLEDLPTGGDEYVKSVAYVNDLNCRVVFGKFCRYRDHIRLEYELLAGNLQAEELMNALNSVATLADHWDDKLQAELGGSTWAAKDEQLNDGQRVVET